MHISVGAKFGVLLGLLAVMGCGGGSSPNPNNPTPPASNASTIDIVGQSGTQAFSPNPSSYGGKDVVFKNNTAVTHHIVLNDGTGDFGAVGPGATSQSVMMPLAGTNYHCTIHPGMIGSVNDSSGGAGPPCQGPYCTGY